MKKVFVILFLLLCASAAFIASCNPSSTLKQQLAKQDSARLAELPPPSHFYQVKVTYTNGDVDTLTTSIKPELTLYNGGAYMQFSDDYSDKVFGVRKINILK